MNELVGVKFKWLEEIIKCCAGEISAIFSWVFTGFVSLLINSF
jgi:hypothetical protein